jgi:TadE-like protein
VRVKFGYQQRFVWFNLFWRINPRNLCYGVNPGHLQYAFFLPYASEQLQFYRAIDGADTMRRLHTFLDERGTAAIEFAMTAPAFFIILLGIIEGGLLLWTQLGLQHGVEMAARCASINASICGSTSAVQNYAAQQALGLSPPTSIFTVSTPACGNQVSANYTFQFLTTYFGLPTIAINAQSCFPK